MRRADRRELAIAAAAFLAGLALRIVFLTARRENYDLESLRLVLDIIDRGGSFYDETTRYNYSPVWAFLAWGLRSAGRAVGLSLQQAVSFFLLAVDALSALLLFRIARSRGSERGRALLVCALFFANPVSILVSSYLTAFDDLSIAFVLLALLCAEEPVREVGAAVSLGASLLVKHVTAFHPLLLLRRPGTPRVTSAVALLPYAIFGASFLPFWSSRRAIWQNVFLYRSLSEPYGTDALRFLPAASAVRTALFVAAAAGAAFWLRRVELARGSLLLFLVVLIFAPGIVVYYFVWPVALGALFPSVGYLVYTGVVTAFLVHSPDVLAQEIPHLPGWSGPWWAAVFWLLWELRGRERRRRAALEVGSVSAAGGSSAER